MNNKKNKMTEKFVVSSLQVLSHTTELNHQGSNKLPPMLKPPVITQ